MNYRKHYPQGWGFLVTDFFVWDGVEESAPHPRVEAQYLVPHD